MQSPTSRFERPSCSLEPISVLARTTQSLCLASVTAIAIHLGLTKIGVFETERRVTKPLTAQFVKRQPRLTKPLELKKRPRARPRLIQRQMVTVKARADLGRTRGRFEPVRVMERFAKPSVRLERGHSWAASELEPEAVAQGIRGVKETKEAMDLTLELLDICALDTGRYHAMVVQDPLEKQNIRGFFRLKYAYSQSMRERGYHDFESRILQNLVSLIETVNRYTLINATFEGRVSFDSAELLQTPWVYIQIGPYPFEMSLRDKRNLGRYMTQGGFVFCEAHDLYVSGEVGLRNPLCLYSAIHMLTSAMEGQGLRLSSEWAFDRVPDDHPLYHCYFDFDGLPGGVLDSQFLQSGYLRGAVIEGRLVAVLSNKGIMHLWGDPDKPQLKSQRFLQLGINTIVFALTQEGSITKRVMDMAR